MNSTKITQYYDNLFRTLEENINYQIEILKEKIETEYLRAPLKVIIIAFLIAIATGIIIYCICAYISKKQKQFVMETSERYKALINLNDSYNFYENLREEFYEKFSVDTKSKFDRFNFDANMKARLANKRDTYLQRLAKIYYNNDKFQKYLKDVKNLLAPTVEPEGYLNIKKYQRIEEKLFEENILHPTIDVVFYADVKYTSPKGRNSYRTRYKYTPHDIENLLIDMKKAENYKATKEYQRSLMTDSLRYDILKRDGFRCVLCGRSAANGATLHVDHIRPISKGGKTEYSNLRTLCEQCNLGKSDKWAEHGIN